MSLEQLSLLVHVQVLYAMCDSRVPHRGGEFDDCDLQQQVRLGLWNQRLLAMAGMRNSR